MIFQLFFSFAKVGLLTFGGGMAMLPMLQRECVDKRGWASEDEMLNYYAIGQCTPGIIAVNVATFIGYKKKGTIGGIAATLGVVFPSIVIITVIASFLAMYSNNYHVQRAFAGIRIAVTALILVSVFRMGKKTLKDFETVFLALLAFAVQTFLGLSPVVITLSAIAYALIRYRIAAGRDLE